MGGLHSEEAGTNSGKIGNSTSASNAITATVGALLFLMLCYTTTTVWVREAWALQWFQIGVYSLVVVQVLNGPREENEETGKGIIPRLIYVVPLWGLVQIVFHTTASTFETRGEVLRWGALVGVFYLTSTITCSRRAQRRLLNAILCFATGMAVLCLMQLNTSNGSILWVIQSHYSDIYATFQNKNNYVQFVEMALPIALWGAVRCGRFSWWYALAGGVLYASAVSAASRAGVLLCTAELISILAIGLARFRSSGGVLKIRYALPTILIVPAVAGAFSFAVGWKSTLERFNEKDQFAIRREYLLGAMEMVKNRPLTGYGLGTFVQVYQKYSSKDFYPFYANHVHNDWAEFAADGGLPFLAFVSLPFLRAIPLAIRHPWGLGIVATMFNACVDYPFPRPAVSGWMFAILAALYMTRTDGGEEELASNRRSPIEAGVDDGQE
jgi:O-antigen ligase